MKSNREQLLESAGLRVRFHWRGDRYAHEIWQRSQTNWVCRLASVEGSSQDDWPASPPLQSLEIEKHADGTSVALLVGMAGTSHWSASVRIDPQSRCVLFDVACRVRDPQAGPLGSAYRSNAAAPIDDWITLDAEPAFATGRVQRDGELVRVALAPPPESAARTIRWAYRVCPAVSS